jgi:hypothetical protein
MLNPSTAMVSTATATGLAAFFTRARLGLPLATVRFVAFPRATLVSLRARAVAAFLFWTFDGCFLRLAIIDPRLVLRKDDAEYQQTARLSPGNPSYELSTD